MNAVRTALLALALAACHGGPRSPTPPAATAAAPALLRTLPAAEQAIAGPLAIAADAGHLFWSGPEGIVVARPDGSEPRTLVADVFVTAMEAHAGRLFYRDGDDVLWEVAVTGGPPRRVPPPEPGVARPLASDETVRVSDERGSVEVFATGGGLIVTDGTARPRVILPPASGHRWGHVAPVLVGDSILAADASPDHEVGLWRLPRQPAGAPVLLTTEANEPAQLAPAGDALYALELPVDDPSASQQLVRYEADGRRTALTSTGAVVAVDADPTGVAYALLGDDDLTSVWLAEPGRPAREVARGLDVEVVGVALAPRAVFWIADGTIWSAPRAGGLPARFHQPEWGDAGGSGLVHLVIDGSSVYFTSVGLGATGVHRTRGGADATELWPPPEDGLSDDLAQVGGALFVVAGRTTVWRVPMNGEPAAAIYTAPEGRDLMTLAGGGGRLYAALSAEQSTSDIVSIDPTTGAASVYLHVPDERPALAADASALHVAVDNLGWILRAPHAPR